MTTRISGFGASLRERAETGVLLRALTCPPGGKHGKHDCLDEPDDGDEGEQADDDGDAEQEERRPTRRRSAARGATYDGGCRDRADDAADDAAEPRPSSR